MKDLLSQKLKIRHAFKSNRPFGHKVTAKVVLLSAKAKITSSEIQLICIQLELLPCSEIPLIVFVVTIYCLFYLVFGSSLRLHEIFISHP